jgi:hypothetical protein
METESRLAHLCLKTLDFVVSLKVLADRGNENHLHNVLAVITCYAKSLHKKNDQNFQWKFTITVVETLTAFINQKSGTVITLKILASYIVLFNFCRIAQLGSIYCCNN